MRLLQTVVGVLILPCFYSAAEAQESPAPKPSEPVAQATSAAPVAVTLKRAIELALQNSKEIQVAKIQASVADHAAQITKAQFMPNLYAGSGAGYTNGIPETPGGRAPSVFNVTYTEQVFNEPLRGQSKELTEQAKARKIEAFPGLAAERTGERRQNPPGHARTREPGVRTARKSDRSAVDEGADRAANSAPGRTRRRAGSFSEISIGFAGDAGDRSHSGRIA